MKKRFLGVILAIAMAISFSVQAFAASYTDISGHWAEEYLEDLADRGLLTGYQDGTMRPDLNMTTCQLLVLLSRLYSPTTVQKELITEDYGSIVKTTVPTTFSWAYDNLAICLASGILTQSELNTISLSSDIQKEQFALFLTRALQLSDAADALSDSVLSYTDAADISESCRGSVAELASLGIVQGTSDNQFLPQSHISRAVVAAMVSRSLDYLKNNSLTLEIEKYKGYTEAEGIISSVDASTLELCGFDGLTREFIIPSGASVTVNDVSKTITSAYEGEYAKITLKNGTVTGVTIDTDSTATWVQGTVSSTTSTSSENSITVVNPTTGNTTTYQVSTSATITQDDSTVPLTSVSYEDFVTLMLQGNVVTKIRAASGNDQFSGTISQINYGTTTIFKVLGEDGSVYCFSLDIAALPVIKRGDTVISLDRLKVGDTVSVTRKNFAVSLIQEAGTENEVTGELTSVTTTTSGTNWVITTDSGSTMTLSVDEEVSVYNGSTSILLSDIQVGDTVKVVIYDSTITEIYLQSQMASSTKVSGTVLNVDASNKQITVLTSSNKLIYIKVTSSTTILATSTGKTVSLSSVSSKSSLAAYGSYSSSTVFTATSIVIE